MRRLARRKRADEYNEVMRFDVAGPHVARALRRCASAVRELHVPRLPDGLPADVCFPRLTLVAEYQDPWTGVHEDALARAPVVVDSLRCAPRLQRWLLRSTADAVSTAMSHALDAGVAAERAACRSRELLCCTPAVTAAMRGLLPPERDLTDVHACFTARCTPPGVGVLECLFHDLPRAPARQRG